MEWLLKNNDPQQIGYELRNASGKLLVLTFHAKTGTIRVSYNDEKRAFLFGKEGFLRNRTVLRNEYGIWIGQLVHEGGQGHQGNIEISGEIFNYSFQNNSFSTAVISKNGEVLSRCKLPEVAKNNNGADHDLLILTLGWYLAVAVKKLEEEYA